MKRDYKAPDIEQLNIEVERGFDVIMVSHDINAAINYASHILHISHTPLFFGTKEDYVKTDIGRTFTGMPGGAL